MKKYILFLSLALLLLSCESARELVNERSVLDELEASSYEPKTDFEKSLQSRGFELDEIRAMSAIAKESYPGSPRSIIFDGGHFCYDGYDRNSTHANCGLYSAKKLMHHLGQLGIVSADLWFQYSDRELRDIVVDEITHDERERNQSFCLQEESVAGLLVFLGVPPEYISIIRRGSFWERALFARIAVAEKKLELIGEAEADLDLADVKIANGFYNVIGEHTYIGTFLNAFLSSEEAERIAQKTELTAEIKRLNQNLAAHDYSDGSL
jgi:hypothetical protein